MNFTKIHESTEDDHSKDRYLITYADLITLLLGLFVILYASAQVDDTKYKEFTKAFSKVFKNPKNGVLDGSNGVLDGGKGVLKNSNSVLDSKNDPLEKIALKIEEKLGIFINNGQVEFKNNGNELILSLPEKLLFESGKANIK